MDLVDPHQRVGEGEPHPLAGPEAERRRRHGVAWAGSGWTLRRQRGGGKSDDGGESHTGDRSSTEHECLGGGWRAARRKDGGDGNSNGNGNSNSFDRMNRMVNRMKAPGCEAARAALILF